MTIPFEMNNAPCNHVFCEDCRHWQPTVKICSQCFDDLLFLSEVARNEARAFETLAHLFPCLLVWRLQGKERGDDER